MFQQILMDLGFLVQYFATLIKYGFVFYEMLTYLCQNAAYYLLCLPSFDYSLVNIWVSLSKFIIAASFCERGVEFFLFIAVHTKSGFLSGVGQLYAAHSRWSTFSLFSSGVYAARSKHEMQREVGKSKE